MPGRGLRLVWLTIALLLPAAGCQLVAAIGILTAPRQIQKAEYTLIGGRLAVLVEAVRPDEDSPVFRHAFQQRLDEIFRDKKEIEVELVPVAEIEYLRQRNIDFSKWSIQKVGREVDAEQVLYVRIEQLRFLETPDSPVLAPRVRLWLKLIGTYKPADAARLWPTAEEPNGRMIERERPITEYTGPTALDSEMRKLAREAAFLTAMPFYDVDREDKIPWER